MHRGALDLLAAYDGDSSDDEVPGAKVSTKRTYKESEEGENVKRLCGGYRKLPVPPALLNDDKPKEEHFDDPNLHDGRLRSFPHERGNWATYAYISCEYYSEIMNIKI